MDRNETTMIQTANGPKLVPLHHSAGGLGVAEPTPGAFTVTHLRSGRAVWPRNHGCDNAEAAQRALVAAVHMLDWTQDHNATISATPARHLRAILNRMRLAAAERIEAE